MKAAFVPALSLTVLLTASSRATGANGGTPAGAAPVIVQVDAGRLIAERPHSLIGANIEDLNFQLYGGLYSQLLHGECFEEHVDPTELLGLEGPQRLAVWVLLDEHGRPVLRHFTGRSLTRLYGAERPADWSSTAPRDANVVPVGSLTFRGGVILPSELPAPLGDRLVALATGDAQVSRHWRRVQSGTAAGKLTLVREGVFTGRQAQQIRYASGEGELGIDNAGLFHDGINLAAGRAYEGVLRIRSDTAADVFVSLRSERSEVLAEQALRLDAKPGPHQYQRLTFSLTPRASDPRGRFALVLKQPGTMTIDYAFLQAGEWGRYAGLPVRREMADALIGMGVATMRYNGSMLNRCPDGPEHYKWKQMIGPADERAPYHGFFNPYASHGFSVFEFMDFCEAAGIFPLFGLRIDETEPDLADLVDYCLGGPETEWGRRRIANGHPRPYFLKAVQIGNEQIANAEYVDRFKALAATLWAKDRNLIVLASVNVRYLVSAPLPGPKGKQQKAGLDHMVELARWVQAQVTESQFVLDSHYQSAVDHADTGLLDFVGWNLRERLARVVPGFALRLWPMEENGDRCTWERGLAHAHNLNTLSRLPPGLERAGTANSFQAWNLALIWDQGRIHFTPSQIFFQPSYYVDRMFADEWLPIVVQSECADPRLDVLAKKSRDGSVLTIYLVNLADAPVTTTLRINGLAPRSSRVTCIGSADLTARNTPLSPTAVAPRNLNGTWNPSNPQIELPARSFTTVRLTNH